MIVAMSHLALSPDQFRFVKAAPRSMEAQKKRSLSFNQLHVPSVGASLYWHPKTGEIANIGVPSDQQRRGVATQMWNEAHRIAGETRGVRPPRHSPDRTAAGDAWARSLGGRLPRRSSWMNDDD